ncbi:triose-phosphate isomerase [Candidatus Dojkabacteria bacterium]|uniref:Triosephosphate isomerase n=1 Tax=Candidatus Dojkabacteria bacterium TaxID=2099670 RepID=A0A3M0Z2B9_9BACT|nr:MAG: triose-phosphate isomerase [Candidatus Dojkabacteria bacterium]
MLILNLKNYEESTTTHLWKLLDSLNTLVEERPDFKEKLLIAPSMVFLLLAKERYPNLNFISQHVDDKEQGSTTGWTPAEVLVSNGINFSLINHSEHRVLPKNYVDELQSKGIKVIACCENLDEAEIFLKSKAWAIAYEPKDLIGSGVSVTNRSEDVKKFTKALKGKTKVIVGAGITKASDIKASIELGADGVLVASAFVKSQDPYSKGYELLNVFGEIDPEK